MLRVHFPGSLSRPTCARAPSPPRRMRQIATPVSDCKSRAPARGCVSPRERIADERVGRLRPGGRILRRC
eukprot:15483089-Alexandrium_andersonii.AAC.1